MLPAEDLYKVPRINQQCQNSKSLENNRRKALSQKRYGSEQVADQEKIKPLFALVKEVYAHKWDIGKPGVENIDMSQHRIVNEHSAIHQEKDSA